MPNDNGERTVRDVYEEMTDEQKNVTNFMIAKAVEEEGGASAE